MAINELTFEDASGHLVVITSNVLSRLLSFRQLTPDSHEAAGVLIGERRGAHLVIHTISEPGEGDLQSRSSVDRCGTHHQAVVNDAFRNSSGTLQYLGEWHTHPEDYPQPSSRDRQSWRMYLTASVPMVLIIVGRKHLWAAKKTEDVIMTLTKT
ncbi:peptidase [Rahnella sp. CG8]|uniref:CBASS system CD-NTase/cGAS isopeptidase Cap3 n=1 Tax=Rahnella sp. CG8 TaxID=2726078 RepID=UPI002033634C|nr:Mov34/MPN/PAD-1 family protein [Rahnella sp. CG8]MCM2446252.1 peptidase [Rahnella sp. CG8]